MTALLLSGVQNMSIQEETQGLTQDKLLFLNSLRIHQRSWWRRLGRGANLDKWLRDETRHYLECQFACVCFFGLAHSNYRIFHHEVTVRLALVSGTVLHIKNYFLPRSYYTGVLLENIHREGRVRMRARVRTGLN